MEEQAQNNFYIVPIAAFIFEQHDFPSLPLDSNSKAVKSVESLSKIPIDFICEIQYHPPSQDISFPSSPSHLFLFL